MPRNFIVYTVYKDITKDERKEPIKMDIDVCTKAYASLSPYEYTSTQKPTPNNLEIYTHILHFLKVLNINNVKLMDINNIVNFMRYISE